MTDRLSELNGFAEKVSHLPLTYYAVDFEHSEGYKEDDRYEVDLYDPRANVVSSQIDGSEGDHIFAVDIDLPVAVLPSSTPGHFHLYIDKTMAWDDYLLVLKAMAAAGLVEPGYVEASERREATCLRLPWVKKDAPASPPTPLAIPTEPIF